MTANIRFIKIFLVTFLASSLLFQISTRGQTKGEESRGKEELGAAAHFIFVFDGDLKKVRDLRSQNPVLEERSDREIYIGIFFLDWYLPHIYYTGEYSKKADDYKREKDQKEREAEIESVVDHLQPIVLGGPEDNQDRTSEKMDDDTAKKVGHIFDLMQDERFRYIMNDNIIIWFSLLYRAGLFNQPSEPKAATDEEVGDVKKNISMMEKALEKQKGSDKSIRMENRGGKPCFAPDTLVLMADGTYKKILDIGVGDLVVGYDFEKMRATTSTIIATAISQSDITYIINDDLKATGQHPFYAEDGSVVRVFDFNDDTILLGDTDGDRDTLEPIALDSVERVGERGFFYSIMVETTNNYFVRDGSGRNYVVKCCISDE